MAFDNVRIKSAGENHRIREIIPGNTPRAVYKDNETPDQIVRNGLPAESPAYTSAIVPPWCRAFRGSLGLYRVFLKMSESG